MEVEMNKSHLVWGIIFLALAMLLSAANLALPAEDLMFTIGKKNLPWVPAIILGVLGLAFLTSAARGWHHARG
jgi:hypothetical protein